MPVTVKYFAQLREVIGREEETLEFEGSVSDFKSFLKEKYKNIEDLIDSSRVAVNEEYVEENAKIKKGDRVALIPPVGGG